MRDITGQEYYEITGSHFQTHKRLFVKDVLGTEVPLHDLEDYDWIISSSWGHQVDQPCMNATIELVREHDGLSLSPLKIGSPLNRTAGAYAPLLNPGRYIRLETATVAAGGDPGARWRSVFEGKIDKVDFKSKKNRVILSCRDMGAYLLDKFIKNEIEYIPDEETAIEGEYYGDLVHEVMQAMLDDNNYGTNGEIVNLQTPDGAPPWAIGPFKQIQEPLLIAQRKLASQIGWVARYKYTSGNNFEYCLFNPFREKTQVDYILTGYQYHDVPLLNLEDKNVRNSWRVRYFNKAALAIDTVERENSASIAEFGERFAEITEGDASNIDTQGEAEVMCQAAVDDTSLPKVNHSIEMLYFWPVEVGDLVQLNANSIHYDYGQRLAVVGYRHTLTNTQQRTKIDFRGSPAGAYESWLRHRDPPPLPSVIMSVNWTPSGIGDQLEETFGTLYYPERHYYFADCFLQINQYTKSVLIEIEVRQVSFEGSPLDGIVITGAGTSELFFEEGSIPWEIFNGKKKYRVRVVDPDGNEYVHIITHATDGTIFIDGEWGVDDEGVMLIPGGEDWSFDVWEPLYWYYHNVEVDEWHRIQWPGEPSEYGLPGALTDDPYLPPGWDDIHKHGGSAIIPPDSDPVYENYVPPPDPLTAGSHQVIDTEDAPFAFVQNEGPVIFRVTPFTGSDGWMFFGKKHKVNAGIPDDSGSGQVDDNKSGAGLAGRRRTARPMFEYKVDPLSRPMLTVDEAYDWGTLAFDQEAIDPTTEERTDPAVFYPDFQHGACHRIKLTEDTVIELPVNNTVYSLQGQLDGINWNNSNFAGFRIQMVDGDTGEIKEQRSYVEYEPPEENPPVPGDPDYYGDSYTVNEDWTPDLFDEENGDYYQLLADDGMWSSETLHLYIESNGFQAIFGLGYAMPGGAQPSCAGLCHANFIMNHQGQLSGVTLIDIKDPNVEYVEI
jgi:hypothetical protein